MKYIISHILLLSVSLAQLDVRVYTDKVEYYYNEPVEIYVSGHNTTNDTLFLSWGSSLQWNYAIDGDFQLAGLGITSNLTILPDSTYIWNIIHYWAIEPGYHEIVGLVDNYGISNDTTHISVSPLAIESETGKPQKTSLVQNYPNPFNSSTTIKYDIPEFAEVSLIIYDISGREVNRLVSISQPPGSYTVSWNGRDHSGREVAGGMYFARLQASDNSSVAKMVYLR